MTTTDFIFSSTDDRAIGAVVGYQNYLRESHLSAQLSDISGDFNAAIDILDETMNTIQEQFIDTDRGGACGVHGFIAEVAECGTVNADEVARGNDIVYTWVNDNGPIDMIRDGVPIQSKFCASADGMSLTAVKSHLDKYPWFISSGGKYVIPKDQYEKILYLLSIPEDAANKMGTETGEFSLRDWKFVHEYFDNSGITLDDLEPSKLDYAEVQAYKIESTIDQSKEEIGVIRDDRENTAIIEHKPSVREGLISAGIGAAIQGGSTFVLEMFRLMKSGKKIKDFTDSDWMSIIKKSGIGIIDGGIKAGAIYAITNTTGISSTSASGLISVTEGIGKQVYLYSRGKIDTVELIENAEIICLDTCISVLSTFAGQTIIPIPIIGAIVGNIVGTTAYGYLKRFLLDKEENIYKRYCCEIEELNLRIDDEYRRAVELLAKDCKQFLDLLERVDSEDVMVSFSASVAVAQKCCSNRELIVEDIRQIDTFFLT